MMYNVRIKVFPDETRQYMWSSKGKIRDYTLEEPRKKTGDSIERGEEQNEKRAKQMVYDLARSNSWEYFITLTFKDPTIRYSYEKCCDEIKKYTKHLGKMDCRWIIVPEQHKDGAWHFHGLIAGPIKATRATNAHTGQPLVDKHGREVYNLTDYKAGFTTAVKVDGSPKVATYLTKYYTKDMQIPKGKKRYWASRNLARPQLYYDELDSITFEDLMDNARYRKEIKSPYGDFILVET